MPSIKRMQDPKLKLSKSFSDTYPKNLIKSRITVFDLRINAISNKKHPMNKYITADVTIIEIILILLETPKFVSILKRTIHAYGQIIAIFTIMFIFLLIAYLVFSNVLTN